MATLLDASALNAVLHTTQCHTSWLASLPASSFTPLRSTSVISSSSNACSLFPENFVLNPTKNKLGRSYNPGRPLAVHERDKILSLFEQGYKISHIAREIGVTHSCVSKIMTRYRRTGSIYSRAHQLRRKPMTSSSDSEKSAGSDCSAPSSPNSLCGPYSPPQPPPPPQPPQKRRFTDYSIQRCVKR